MKIFFLFCSLLISTLVFANNSKMVQTCTGLAKGTDLVHVPELVRVEHITFVITYVDEQTIQVSCTLSNGVFVDWGLLDIASRKVTREDLDGEKWSLYFSNIETDHKFFLQIEATGIYNNILWDKVEGLLECTPNLPLPFMGLH